MFPHVGCGNRVITDPVPRMKKKTMSGMAVTIVAAALLLPSVGRAAGAYLGASLVMAKVDADYSGFSFSNKRDSNLGFHAGYRFGGRIAFEASYARLGNGSGSLCMMDACIPETGTFDFEAERVELVLLAFLPLGRNVELFGKAGAGRVTTQARIYPWDGDPSYFDSADTGGIFGAGVAWRHSQRLALRLQFDRHQSSSSDGTAFWAGAMISLGR
jgi:hypothetical protein